MEKFQGLASRKMKVVFSSQIFENFIRTELKKYFFFLPEKPAVYSVCDILSSFLYKIFFSLFIFLEFVNVRTDLATYIILGKNYVPNRFRDVI